MGLKAVIFDCDGVIADDEMVHLAAFRKVLKPIGVEISQRDYISRYLGFDDLGAIRQALIDHRIEPSQSRVRTLAADKSKAFRELITRDLVIYPGVVALVHKLACYRLAVASGALREEIDLILSHAGLASRFEAIVSAESVSRGKPDPEPFLAALETLSHNSPLEACECLVVEDSLAGVEAAHRAGMRCLAVTNSYKRSSLAKAKADLIVDSLSQVEPDDLAKMFPAVPSTGSQPSRRTR